MQNELEPALSPGSLHSPELSLIKPDLGTSYLQLQPSHLAQLCIPRAPPEPRGALGALQALPQLRLRLRSRCQVCAQSKLKMKKSLKLLLAAGNAGDKGQSDSSQHKDFVFPELCWLQSSHRDLVQLSLSHARG